MNDSALHNSYKCYDSIPTPSPTLADSERQQLQLQQQQLHSQNQNQPQSKQLNDFMHQSLSVNANSNIIVNQINSKNNRKSNNNSADSNLIRTASLDSLINSSEEQDGSGSNHTNSEEDDDDEDDVLSDSDSLCELKHMCDSSKNNSDEYPRKSDIEELKNVEAPKEPVIKAYLEKCHKKCEIKNCCFKKPDPDCDIIEDTNYQNTKNNNINNNKQQQQPQPIVKTNSTARRNSIASSISVSRMETIIEEPNEPKISVKEILARFETLREAAEVKLKLTKKSRGN